MTPLRVSCWRGKFLQRTQEWYSFNYYLYTMEQWALRTWMWCSCATGHKELNCTLFFFSVTDTLSLIQMNDLSWHVYLQLHQRVSVCEVQPGSRAVLLTLWHLCVSRIFSVMMDLFLSPKMLMSAMSLGNLPHPSHSVRLQTFCKIIDCYTAYTVQAWWLHVGLSLG